MFFKRKKKIFQNQKVVKEIQKREYGKISSGGKSKTGLIFFITFLNKRFSVRIKDKIQFFLYLEYVGAGNCLLFRVSRKY